MIESRQKTDIENTIINIFNTLPIDLLTSALRGLNPDRFDEIALFVLEEDEKRNPKQQKEVAQTKIETIPPEPPQNNDSDDDDDDDFICDEMQPAILLDPEFEKRNIAETFTLNEIAKAASQQNQHIQHIKKETHRQPFDVEGQFTPSEVMKAVKVHKEWLVNKTQHRKKLKGNGSVIFLVVSSRARLVSKDSGESWSLMPYHKFEKVLRS